MPSPKTQFMYHMHTICDLGRPIVYIYKTSHVRANKMGMMVVHGLTSARPNRIRRKRTGRTRACVCLCAYASDSHKAYTIYLYIDHSNDGIFETHYAQYTYITNNAPTMFATSSHIPEILFYYYVRIIRQASKHTHTHESG